MDPGLAGCWWQAGVAKGSHSAEFYLGIWYEFGQAGTKDHTEAMRLLHRAADSGFVPARDTLVCLSPEVQRAMEELMVEVGSAPEALAANVFGALLFGVTAKEEDFSVVDMAPGDFSSDVNFSCTFTAVLSKTEFRRGAFTALLSNHPLVKWLALAPGETVAKLYFQRRRTARRLSCWKTL